MSTPPSSLAKNTRAYLSDPDNYSDDQDVKDRAKRDDEYCLTHGWSIGKVLGSFL
jgi:hypothetical protein